MTTTLLLPTIPLLLILLLYHYLLSPGPKSLSRIPAAHPTAPFSSLWILLQRFRGREIAAVHAAHARLGPVVRLGPNEVTVNCVQGGVGRVGAWEKDGWYAFFANFGVPNMFSTTAAKPHSARKRMLSNIYSKSSIQASESLRAATSVILYDRLLPSLANSRGEPVNILAMFFGANMDFVTARQFGLSASSNFTQDTATRDRFLRWYTCRRSYNFWPQELPRFTALMAKLGVRLVPKFVDEANAEIEKFTLGMCDKAAALVGQEEGVDADSPNFPAVYAHLDASLRKEESRSPSKLGSGDEHRLAMASEMLDHLAAGFETSGITLTYLVHELSLRPELQSALRGELGSLRPPVTAPSRPGLPNAKALDALPLLQAILQETLRLHAAIPGGQPRVTPSGGALGPPGHEHAPLPAGVRVNAQAWSLHRNEDVFPDAGQWQPQRWMDSRGGLLAAESDRFREMMRWFWAFGSGGRMCVGNNLAVYQIKFIVAAIYTNYTTKIVDDAGIEQMDLYTAPPQSEKLMFAFEPVQE